MGIRKYIERDFDEIVSLLSCSFPECSSQINDSLKSPKSLNIDTDKYIQLVAIENYKVVGYLLASRSFDPIVKRLNYWIDYVCVAEEYRGRGIAKKMLGCVESMAKNENVLYLQLTSSRFRTTARGLYTKLGFSIRESDIFRKVL